MKFNSASFGKLVISVLCFVNVVSLLLIYRHGNFRRKFATSESHHAPMNLITKSLDQTSRMISEESEAMNSKNAYRRLGFASMDLMKEMPFPRPLFNYTLIPWRINANEPRFYPQDMFKIEHRWSMIILVKSHAEHYDRRSAVRDTWAAFEYLNGVRIETVFVVGMGKNSDSEVALLKENRKHGDVLQINMKEIYKDVGMKTLAGMQWASQNFPQDWIYTSADDDMLPNWIQLVDDIEEVMRYGEEITGRNLPTELPIHSGFRFAKRELPNRKKIFTFYVDNDTYPVSIYPSYCHGGWYSMPVSLCSGIYGVSRKHLFFYLDDVWITGLLRLLYFDGKDITYFGKNKTEQGIGIWMKKTEKVIHAGSEESLRERWRERVKTLLDQVKLYVKS